MYTALKSGHITHCTDETRQVETVELFAVVILLIDRSISDKVTKCSCTGFQSHMLRQVGMSIYHL